jgi:Cytochrome B561
MLFLGFFLDSISDTSQRNNWIQCHKLTGLAILALILLRLFWALLNAKPSLPALTPKWQRIAERSVHFSMYAILVAMPLSVWVMSVASGYAPKLNGLVLGLPVPENKLLATTAFNAQLV